MESNAETRADVSQPSARRSLALGVVVTFGIRIYGAALQYLTQIYLARTIFAQQVGIYAFAWTVVSLLAFLTPLGFDTSLVRFIPADLAKREWGRVHGILRLSQRATLICSIVAATLCAACVLAVDHNLESHGSVAVLLSVVMIPIVGMLNLFQGIARAFHWILHVAGPAYFVRPTLFFVAAWIAIEAFDRRTGEDMIIAALVACALTFAFQYVTYRRLLPREVVAAEPVSDALTWRRTSLPMMLVASFELLLANTDILMMFWIRGAAETGVYNIAVRTSASLLFLFFAMTAFAAPRIAATHAQGDRRGLLEFAAKMRLFVVMPTIAGAVVLLLAGRMLFDLFGHEFTSAYAPCMILTGGVVFRTLSGPSDSLLTMTGRERQLAVVLATACSLNIVLNTILIPFYGGIGAAIATTVSVATEVILISTFAGRHLGFRPFLFTPTERGSR
ncbi:MAG: flippase [Planctomycetes bacterium]|nr:flippase [Planctomycetota bacterium]